MRVRVALILSQSVLLVAMVACFAQQQKLLAGQLKEGVLTAEVVGAKLMPEKVFFHGQLTKVQSSNSGGVRYGNWRTNVDAGAYGFGFLDGGKFVVMDLSSVGPIHYNFH